MTKRMLVDATHPEETRVAVVDGTWLSDFDFERASRKQLKGNIYLAKVIRIEPSLQAAFVEYGGNRHGFLPFSEIHPDYFRIPMADRPHDEEIEPEDEDEPSSLPAEIAAEMQPDEGYESEHDDHDHDHEEEFSREVAAEMAPEPEPAIETRADAGPIEPVGEAPYTAETPYADTASSPVSEFGNAADNDLGLITDFGNAVVGDPALAPPAGVPVETVGGEAADAGIIEQRRRFPPRGRYKIQEVVKRRQVMLIQVVKEERGNKGAALTTFLSLAGRYCVLMPNTEHGGGVSRKITSHQDRRRMKDMLDQLEIPEGMAVILRTAGMEQEPAEIQRDLEYLLRLWNNIREQTLQSTAPALIYEEANLIKRSMRDLYTQDVGEVLVSGKHGYELARDFMQTIMPDDLEKIKLYEESIPLFFRYRVESQIDQLYSPTVQLRSGGYIVINPTEALVSIDVNSGRATRERHIEGTALKTNLEASDEIARQLRLRDLAGLVVIDFIDMEDGRNNAAVERRLKEAMRNDRARLQIGRISPFGLLELSRQRLHPSLMEINFEKCVHCAGVGFVRSVDSAALSILRMIEEEGIKQGPAELVLHVPTTIALYILNQKRPALNDIERRYGLQVLMHSDDNLVPPDFKLERVKAGTGERTGPAVDIEKIYAEVDAEAPTPPPQNTHRHDNGEQGEQQEGGGRHNGRRRGRFGRGRDRDRDNQQPRGDRQNQQQPQQPYPSDQQPAGIDPNGNVVETDIPVDDSIGNNEGISTHEGAPGDLAQQEQQRRRRRGRRGGRGRRNGREGAPTNGNGNQQRTEGGRTENGRHEGRNEGRRDWNRGGGGFEQPMPAGPIPTSIHDIDTTPREPAYSQSSGNRSYNEPAANNSESPRAPRQAISSTPYEIVDQAGDKPKGGWWKKLTGQ